MQTSKPLPQNLTDLGFPEQLILWSVRYWASACRNDHSPYIILLNAYKLAKCPQSLLPLDSIMTLIVTGNCRPVDIRCLCCAGISLDEWRILQSLALSQRDEKQMIPRLLSHFLEPSATRMALPLIREWALSLGSANQLIPIRPDALSIGQQYHPSRLERDKAEMPTAHEQHSLH